MEGVPDFSSPAEEAAFWKEKAAELSAEIKEAKEEFTEFQEGSRELEAELEAQLEQAEGKIKEYRSLSNRLHMDNDELKAKLEQCHKEYAFQINELQTELVEIKSIKDELHKYVRTLEQQNDDLERAKRSTLASLEDFEVKMNATIERNAFLESELDEKESLKAAVQRLKDETRDLRQELRIVTAPAPVSASGGGKETPKRSFSVNDATPLPDNDISSMMQQQQQGSSGRLSSGDSNRQGNNSSAALTPSARQSALHIVGDLLKKVGALGLKLSSCRNIVKENSSRDGMVGGGHRGHASSHLHNGGQLGAVTSTSANNLSSLGTTTAQNTVASITPSMRKLSTSSSKPASPK